MPSLLLCTYLRVTHSSWPKLSLHHSGYAQFTMIPTYLNSYRSYALQLFHWFAIYHMVSSRISFHLKHLPLAPSKRANLLVRIRQVWLKEQRLKASHPGVTVAEKVRDWVLGPGISQDEQKLSMGKCRPQPRVVWVALYLGLGTQGSLQIYMEKGRSSKKFKGRLVQSLGVSRGWASGSK